MGKNRPPYRQFFRPRPQRLTAYLRGLPGTTFTKLEKELNALYLHDCCTPPLQAERGLGGEAPWLIDIIQEIFNTHDFANSNAAAKFFYENLWPAVAQGYAQTWDDIPYYGEDWDMLASLQRNVVHFSNAKDYTMQRDMLNALIDGEGKLRSWGDFKTAAYAIGNIQSNAWLQAEYDLSLTSAQMAAKWNKIVKKSNILPILRYDAILDNHTTFTCKNFDSIQLPVDHWFWTQYYPPNHWGCRSNVQQLAKGEITDLGNIDFPDIPKIFQTNLAKNGLLYPPGHTYYNGYDGSVDVALITKEVKENARKKYVGKLVNIDGIGDVEINWQGIKKAVSSYEKNDDRKIREIQLLNVLPNILQNAIHQPHLDKAEKGKGNFYYAAVQGLDLNVCIKRSKQTIFYGFTLK